MKLTKKLLACSVAALSISAVAPMASAVEVSGSVGIASSYLWRGFDLGDGTPAVSGDLNFSAGGAYGGIWGSSGDTGTGTEYDLYVGYGGEAGSFTYDISVWNYNYPGAADINVGDLTEVILSVGFGPVTFSYYDNVAGGPGYTYMTLGASFGDFGVTLGRHDDDGDENPTHLDVSYAYNDNLSFTVSALLDDADGTLDDDPLFVVSYSLPIGE